MGKMTYKRRKNVKKQSFKKRKNKKMKGGDEGETPEGVAPETTTDTANEGDSTPLATDDNTEGATAAKTEGDSTPPGTDANAEGAEGNTPAAEGAATDDNTPAVEGADAADAAAKNDPEYVKFLEELKANPDEILRKKVYLWDKVEEFFMYDPDKNKWENKRHDVTEGATTTTEGATTTTEGATTEGATTEGATPDAATPDAATPEGAKNDAPPGATTEGATPDAAANTTTTTPEGTATDDDNKNAP